MIIIKYYHWLTRTPDKHVTLCNYWVIIPWVGTVAYIVGHGLICIFYFVENIWRNGKLMGE